MKLDRWNKPQKGERDVCFLKLLPVKGSLHQFYTFKREYRYMRSYIRSEKLPFIYELPSVMSRSGYIALWVM